jgi:hypothetical protein
MYDMIAAMRKQKHLILEGDMTELESVVRKGIEHVPAHLFGLAQMYGLQQVEAESEIQWRRHNGSLKALFYIIPEPGDLDHVMLPFVRTRELEPSLTYCLVHQWEDGEGNWDIFHILPERRMKHAGRVWGKKEVIDRGPPLREDLLSLFASRKTIPEPGREGWLRLLKSSRSDVNKRLENLAAEFGCTAQIGDQFVCWAGAGTGIEVCFEILPDPADIEVFVAIYERIRANDCPITFAFLATEDPNVFDIFSLTRRSYLQHHNQIRQAALDTCDAP